MRQESVARCSRLRRWVPGSTAEADFTLPTVQRMRRGLRDVGEDVIVNSREMGLRFDRPLISLWQACLCGRLGWQPVWARAVLGMWLGRRPAGSAVPALAYAS